MGSAAKSLGGGLLAGGAESVGGGIKDAFFGGAQKDAAKALTKQQRSALAAIRIAKDNAAPIISQGFDDSIREISEGTQRARANLVAGKARANQPFQNFFNLGQESANQEAALLGLSGQDAADAAFQRFQESPGQQFLREEGERAIRRNAAASGQLQGGAVLKELTRFGTGLAQQDFGNYFNRLQGITERGFNAAANLSANETGLSTNVANLETGTAQTLAQLLSGKGQTLGNLELGEATAISPILQNIGQAKAAGIIGQNAGIASGVRELNSLLGGSGGFGVPSAPEAANNLQAVGSIISMFGGGGLGGAGGLSSFSGAFGGAG